MSNKVIKDRILDRILETDKVDADNLNNELLRITVGNRTMDFNESTFPYAIKIIVNHWLDRKPFRAGYWKKWERARKNNGGN